jgi:hypothetical protein
MTLTIAVASATAEPPSGPGVTGSDARREDDPRMDAQSVSPEA